MCYQSDDDELVNAMLFELHIQVCVGKATGTPMLEGHDIARLRFEFSADLATPRAVFEGLVRPSRFLYRRNVLPGLVVAWTVSVMQRIENTQTRLPRSIQDLQHMWNTIICFCNSAQAIPHFASLGNEIVIRVDHKKCSDLLVIRHVCHAPSHPYAVAHPVLIKKPSSSYARHL